MTDDGAKFISVVSNSAGSATTAPAVLTVASSSGSISLSATGGDGQSAVVMTAFPSLLEVTVKDSTGDPVSNESVTFTAPSSGASASFANGNQSMTVTTDARGVANSTALTANSTAGSYTATATASGSIVSTTFNLTNVLSSGGSGLPEFSHVFIVVEENHSFSDVIGNASMPYLNGLANTNSLATEYYADAHPSLPNYFELTVGEGTSITGTLGDSYNGIVTQDNVVRALVAAGKSWKSYAESLPAIGYLGGDSGPYLRRHNPVVYFSYVQQSSTQSNNVVPFSQLATDIENSSLPDYAFIAPNANDDAHDCPVGLSTCSDDQKLAAADQWLSSNIDPLLSSAAFKNSLLIIVFDEAEDSDTTHGGGHVPAILVSPLAKQGYQSMALYQHESVLRLMMEGLGVPDLPGSAARAPDMAEFFQ
jgi:acid phosphatase